MTIPKIILSLLITFISVINVYAQYIWPTDASNYLSATFGETRSAHFHAALDIKTWGQEGYKVFASRDGWVYRLLTTERGYGNAVYLKHDDGSHTLYAHMQRFSSRLTSIADSVRMKDLSFQMDHFLPERMIRVNQGEVIGYTGSSGIGPPHLHFEIRDKEEAPVNPLSQDLDVRDTIAPVFSSLLVEPLTAGSSVNGSAFSNHFRPQINNGVYDFGTVKIYGKAGFAVNAYDMADNVTNKYAVYTLLLTEGKDTLFYEKLNRFTYEEEKQMFMDRTATFPDGRRGYQRLYQKDGGKNPFVIKNDDGSRITSDQAERIYEIEAKDYYGNTARGMIRVIQGPDLPEAGSLNSRVPPGDWYWDNDWVSFTGKEYLDVEKDPPGMNITDKESIYDLYSSAPLQFFRVIPGQQERIHNYDRRISIIIPEGALFDTTSIALRTDNTSEDGIQISLQPEMIPIAKEVRISYYLGQDIPDADKMRLFRVSPDQRRFSYVDSQVIGNTLHARPSQFGEFIIKADTVAPVIRNIRIEKTSWGIWRVEAFVKDEMTGINSAAALFKVNGVQGIAEYDYEDNLLIYYLPGFTPERSNLISISIEDNAGNTAGIEVTR